MSDNQHRPRTSVRSHVQSTLHTGLVAGTLLLIVTWIGAWAFSLRQPVVLAASLAIVMVGLAAIGLRLVFGTNLHPFAGSGMRHAAQPGEQPGATETVAWLNDAEATNLQGKRWSLDVFASIDAQRFAAVCETWFSWAGFDTRSESHRTQEGVDIWLHASRLPGPVAIVRCKHAQDKPVGLQELRDFQGVVATCKPAHGTFTTTSTYTPEALQYAKENDIEVVDGRALLRRILTRTRQSQQALLAVAYNGR